MLVVRGVGTWLVAAVGDDAVVLRGDKLEGTVDEVAEANIRELLEMITSVKGNAYLFRRTLLFAAIWEDVRRVHDRQLLTYAIRP